MPNAVIYARFSCSKQREESIEDQVRVCREAAEKAGVRIVGIYSDSALSGKTDSRPQFRRMVADSDAGKWSSVYVYKLDRFARNRYDAATNRAKLRKNGVELVSATEHISEGADGILLESLLEGMAEYYSAQLSENVRRGIEGKAMKCMVNGRTPYGYRKGADGRFEIDPDEAPVVLRLFETFAETGSITQARDAARAMGRRGRQRAWDKSSAGATLRREQYAGVYKLAGNRVEGGMPAIVDRELFDRVQGMLSKHIHAKRPASPIYLLSGKLYDHDGHQYVGSSGTSHTGAVHRYYRCTETGKAYPRDEIDSRVADAITDILATPDALEVITGLIMPTLDEFGTENREAIDAAKKRIAQIDAEYDNALNAVLKLGLNDRLQAKIEKLDGERANLEASIAELDCSTVKITPEHIEFWLYDLVTTKDVDKILSTFVTSATIQADGSILVECLIDPYMPHDPDPPGRPPDGSDADGSHDGGVRPTIQDLCEPSASAVPTVRFFSRRILPAKSGVGFLFYA